MFIAWNVFQHFYPYFDVVKTDWAAELPRALTAAAADEDERQFAVTMKRFVATLQDGHGSVYYGQGPYAPVTMDRVEGKIVLTYVRDAQGEPVAAGDEVLQILGAPVETLYADAVALTSGATEQWIRFRAMYELTRCSGPVLDLLIARRSDPTHPRQISLRCECSRKGSMSGAFEGSRARRLVRQFRWHQGYGMERYPAEAGIRQGAGLRHAWLFGHGPRFLQHLSKESLASAQWHIPIVLAPDRTSVEWNRSGEWNLPPLEPYLSAKKVFLSNGSAISYAESVMGIVEHYKLGETVGEATAGTNGNVNPFPIPGGQRISWTGMKVLKHDGSRHHGVGIHPTVPVSRTIAGVAAGRDEYLEKAIEILKTQ